MARKNGNGLTDKWQAFADAYLADPNLNQTLAYKTAYPRASEKAAEANAAKLMKENEAVKAYIEKAMAERQERMQIEQDDVLRELARIAFLDIRQAFDDEGRMINVNRLDEGVARAIVSIDQYIEYDGKGDDREAVGITKKVKLADKLRALELIGKHMGMFKEKVEVEPGNALTQFLEAISGTTLGPPADRG